jgi:hypothetical protein
MANLSRGQIWVLASFVASAAMMATTFFLKGDVQIFAYAIIGLFFAAFAVLMSGKRAKENG